MTKTLNPRFAFLHSTSFWDTLLLSIVLIFTAFVRARLMSMPLERDEGEYAYMGQLLLQGIPPYAEAYNMKFPGTYALYALIMAVFGQTAEGIHLGLLCAVLTSMALLFLLCRKLISGMAGVIAAACYALFSLNFAVLGHAGHATQFIVPFMLGGFLILLIALESSRKILFLGSGIFFGLSVIIKQSALPFCVWGFAVAIFTSLAHNKLKKNVLHAALFTIGCVLPLAATCGLLFAAGTFDKFWFWTVTYLAEYASQSSWERGFFLFKYSAHMITRDFWLVWLSVGAGSITLTFHPQLHGKKILLHTFCFFSFLSVCPGLYFRPHYFVTLLPAAAMLAGIFFDLLNARLRVAKPLALILFFAALGTGIYTQRNYLFLENPWALSNRIYTTDRFIAIPHIAEIVRGLTRPDDKIAVLGSEPQIYFYSKRRAATGYLYVYSIMEKHPFALQMQKELIREIENADPHVIVMIKNRNSWGRWPGAETYIFDWMDNLFKSGKYEIAASADMFSKNIVYRTGKEAAESKLISPRQIIVYRKKA